MRDVRVAAQECVDAEHDLITFVWIEETLDDPRLVSVCTTCGRRYTLSHEAACEFIRATIDDDIFARRPAERYLELHAEGQEGADESGR